MFGLGYLVGRADSAGARRMIELPSVVLSGLLGITLVASTLVASSKSIDKTKESVMNASLLRRAERASMS